MDLKTLVLGAFTAFSSLGAVAQEAPQANFVSLAAIHARAMFAEEDTTLKIIKELDPKGQQLLYELSPYYGYELRDPGSRRYDPLFDALANPTMEPLDCTIYLLGNLSKAIKDSTLYKIYTDSLAVSSSAARNSRFTMLMTESLRDMGLETIYVSGDTKTRRWNRGYRNGSRGRVWTNDYIDRVRDNEYFVPIDYVITDELVKSDLFKSFIKNVDILEFSKDFNHMGFITDGYYYEALWDHNPVEEKVVQKSDFYKRLFLHPRHQNYKDLWIPNAVLYVPKGTVAKFRDEFYDTPHYENGPTLLPEELVPIVSTPGMPSLIEVPTYEQPTLSRKQARQLKRELKRSNSL